MQRRRAAADNSPKDNTMTKFAFALAAAALSSSAIMASPMAYAADATLTWHGLDLSTKAGQRELARRTDVAVRTACPDQVLTGTLLQDRSVLDCRASVRAQIAQRVGATNRVAVGN
jgi:UrcA family protein